MVPSPIIALIKVNAQFNKDARKLEVVMKHSNRHFSGATDKCGDRSRRVAVGIVVGSVIGFCGAAFIFQPIDFFAQTFEGLAFRAVALALVVFGGMLGWLTMK